MHRPIQDSLENFLSDPSDESGIPPEFFRHLAACPECAREVKALEAQVQLFQLLQDEQPATLDPGFYARVMDRVEEQASDSAWGAFLDPAFGKRLAYACLALVVLLGGFLLRSEPGDAGNPVPGIVAASPSPNASFQDGTVQPQQRDAVLVSLASFRE